MPSPLPAALPEVSFSEDQEVRHLHLGTPWIQGSMRRDAPFDIELEYVQRMMAWLLFVPPETVPDRHAMQLGLGAGALTKFCFKKLQMRSTAIELNEQVVLACRQWFRLPAPSSRLRIVVADAGQEIAGLQYAGTVDALQVDLYDEEAAAPVLDSPDFYADCRRLLTEEGVMSVNLFGRHLSFEQSVSKMVAAFGESALWAFRPTREGNTVVLALRRPQALERPLMVQRARHIESQWGLPALKWLKTLQPWA
jgi:spermidine synthase